MTLADVGTNAHVFYIALLSLQPRRQNNLKRNTGTASLQTSTPTPNRAPPTPTTGLTPNPSPRGEGSHMLCFYSFTL